MFDKIIIQSLLGLSTANNFPLKSSINYKGFVIVIELLPRDLEIQLSSAITKRRPIQEQSCSIIKHKFPLIITEI